MSEEIARIHQPAAEISEEALKRAEELIEQEEGVQNKFRGRLADFITAVAVLMSLFHLYAAYQIVRTEALRAIHVAFVLRWNSDIRTDRKSTRLNSSHGYISYAGFCF